MIDTLPFIQPSTARVLAFAAHPDDLDFGAAGTVSALTSAGVQVEYCIMTDGDAGGFDDRDPQETARLRHLEQREAAAKVGVQTVHFLGERDGFLEPNQRVIREVVRLIRQIRPNIVMAMHPERAWDRLQRSHPDHLACGEAVTRAIYPAVENPFSFPELITEQGLEAYKVPWLWLYGARRNGKTRLWTSPSTSDAKWRRCVRTSPSTRMWGPWRSSSNNSAGRTRCAAGWSRPGTPRASTRWQ